jgi:DNA-binding MarR family transcriptional regulator
MIEPAERSMAAEETVTDLAFLLSRAFRALRRAPSAVPPEIEALLHGASFSRRHFVALMHIADAGSLSISALSERLNITLPTASIVVQQLTAYGLVERQEDPTDRRRTIIRIDPLQGGWVEDALAQHTQPLRRTLARLDTNERAIFLKSLRIFAEEAEAVLPPAEREGCPHGAERTDSQS